MYPRLINHKNVTLNNLHTIFKVNPPRNEENEPAYEEVQTLTKKRDHFKKNLVLHYNTEDLCFVTQLYFLQDHMPAEELQQRQAILDSAL